MSSPDRPLPDVQTVTAQERRRASVLRRLDALALQQLVQRCAELEAENEALRRQLAWAEDDAEHWHQNTLDLVGDDAGLTQAGQLVRLPA